MPGGFIFTTSNWSMKPVIESLHEFEVLKDISLDRSILLGYVEEGVDFPRLNHEEDRVSNPSALVELLPKSIETLKITRSRQEYDTLQYNSGLLKRKTELVQKLKKISVELGRFKKEQNERSLVAECKTAGVELDLIMHSNADDWRHQSEENNDELHVFWQ